MDQYRMIDAKDITGFFAGFFQFIRSSLVYILTSVKRYFVISVITFFIIAGVGAYTWWLQKPYFESYASFHVLKIGKRTCGEMIQKLDVLIKSHSVKELATTLHMPENLVDPLMSIDAQNIAGSHLYETQASDNNPMYVYVKSKDKTSFIPLQNALLNYLNKDIPYQAKSNEIEKRTVAIKEEFLNKDIALIDTVVLSYSQFLKNLQPAKDTLAGFANISALLSYKDQLENKRMELEWEKRGFDQYIELMHGFTPDDTPAKGDKKQLITLFLSAVLAACLIPAIYRLATSDK